MKVVLFCGGMGMRLREFSELTPKPMVKIGSRPILWHVMKYYAHFGHNEFILCLGWQASAVKEFFLNYDECGSNDFVFSSGGRRVELMNRDIDDWKITFVDTGTQSNIGQRLQAVEKYVGDDECFLANYTDGLTDLHLPNLIDYHRKSGAVGTFLSVKPSQSFHVVSAESDGLVHRLETVRDTNVWMNGGYFVFRREIFQHIRPGEELVGAPFQRLIKKKQLATLRYDGFWTCLDTYKEKQALDERHLSGDVPWQVWNSPSSQPSIPRLPLANGKPTPVAPPAIRD